MAYFVENDAHACHDKPVYCHHDTRHNQKVLAACVGLEQRLVDVISHLHAQQET